MSETKLEWTELATMVKVAAEPERVEIFHCYRPAESLKAKGGGSVQEPPRIYTVYDDRSVTSEMADGTIKKLHLPEGITPESREAELRKKYFPWNFEIEHFPTPEEVNELNAQAIAKREQREFERYVSEAHTALVMGVGDHGIKKSVWTTAKEALSRAIGMVFEYGIAPHNFVKKFSAITEPTPRQQEAYEVLAPLCVRLLDLKDKVYTGRAPDAPPTQKELRLRRSDVGHCGICGRDIMLGNNHRISHHGYRVPMTGRTRSCFGTGYEPIETGPASLVAYLKELEQMQRNLPLQIQKVRQWLEQNPRPVPPQGLDREARHQWVVKNRPLVEQVTGNVNFVASLESDLQRIPQTISDVQAMIDSWEAGQTTTIEHFV